MKEWQLTANYSLYKAESGAYGVQYTEGFPHINISLDWKEDVEKWNITADLAVNGNYSHEEMESLLEIHSAMKKIDSKINTKWRKHLKEMGVNV